jgi:hypothetical protein
MCKNVSSLQQVVSWNEHILVFKEKSPKGNTCSQMQVAPTMSHINGQIFGEKIIQNQAKAYSHSF